ncbi:hypothetical protein MITS9509_01271 [Synechococcus sp. MIT S9509]|uniref:DUF4336 domain-containing protein n=1 Tax=unclassified Synechococcus TaxID=2626047 RepID=UPI0007BB55A3|nr:MULTISPECIES: DUF4336 domain-containing protein [unclassified Synechococcus]KZR87419.1 hypothetical protein MITS9504_00836 [Synechococcus sp. MIT S9504]KZR92821.1 hypothetical protein MITS9509_01271 [Synechococcus sp. MIT S9509]
MPGHLSATEGISSEDQSWPWWPLLPLYPYGRRATHFEELIPGQVWSLEQLQGVYYVAVPIRLTVVKVPGGLMLVNPLPPTGELRALIRTLESEHGPVCSIVLPTASGLEHKLPMGPLARAFPDADLWVCPNQWSFPLQLPLSWLGIPAARTRVLLDDGVPHPEVCEWISLGPLDLGVGCFQEVSCLHRPSGALLVTDALLGISSQPPEVFECDPTPLLFHARDRGDQPFEDTPDNRRRGWSRLVLFASYLRPEPLDVPGLLQVIRHAFRPGLRSARAHFGVYPFAWQPGWLDSANALMGDDQPRLQVAPVLERLVLPRERQALISWLACVEQLKDVRWLVPAHYSAPLAFSTLQIVQLREQLMMRPWAPSEGNWEFLGSIDQTLLDLGVVPNASQS